MTDEFFFDTDCLSSFLIVGQTNLITELYGGKIILPKQVYKELSHPSVRILKSQTDTLKRDKQILVESIETDTEEWDLYYKLTHEPDKGFKIIGEGEAAAISMAKVRGGVLASNNMKDVKGYVEHYGLKHVTAADILYEAFTKGMITEKQGNAIWCNMINAKRKLPTYTFTEYMKEYKQ